MLVLHDRLAWLVVACHVDANAFGACVFCGCELGVPGEQGGVAHVPDEGEVDVEFGEYGDGGGRFGVDCEGGGRGLGEGEWAGEVLVED